jgi:hypothetical protein
MRFVVVVALAAAFVAFGIAGCATPRLDDPPLAVEIVVTGLRTDERTELKQRVCELDGVSDCLLVEHAVAAQENEDTGGKRKSKRKKDAAPPPPSQEARLTFSYRGSLGSLRYRISQLPHPGLEPARADVRLGYRGFDNKPPSIELLEPQDGVVIATKQSWVRVRVPDVDTAAVTIGEEDGVRSGDEFSATVQDLHEGENAIVIRATDQAGNPKETTVNIVVDTTAPALEVEVVILNYDKALVKGKVAGDVEKLTVDGRDVARDLFGTFEKEVAVDPDKSMVEIIAADAFGNAKKIKRSVKVASPMSDSSK